VPREFGRRIAEVEARPSIAEGDAFDPTVWTGRALQAESLEWQRLVLRFCIRPLHGADRSWPSWISARVRSHSDRPSKASWVTRSWTRRRDLGEDFFNRIGPSAKWRHLSLKSALGHSRLDLLTVSSSHFDPLAVFVGNHSQVFHRDVVDAPNPARRVSVAHRPKPASRRAWSSRQSVRRKDFSNAASLVYAGYPNVPYA
jgi:hypothetical protein